MGDMRVADSSFEWPTQNALTLQSDAGHHNTAAVTSLNTSDVI
jgi:hypothetical protein